MRDRPGRHMEGSARTAAARQNVLLPQLPSLCTYYTINATTPPPPPHPPDLRLPAISTAADIMQYLPVWQQQYGPTLGIA